MGPSVGLKQTLGSDVLGRMAPALFSCKAPSHPFGRGGVRMRTPASSHLYGYVVSF